MVGAWALILTLMFNNGQRTTAMTSVPGFDSEAACRAAGVAWGKDIRDRFDSPRGLFTTSTLCVNTKQP
jgi:hypothetical protein